MITSYSLKPYVRSLLASCAAVLFTACSAAPVKCEQDKIPPELLQVPSENQMCKLMLIFDPSSCSSEKPASSSDSN